MKIQISLLLFALLLPATAQEASENLSAPDIDKNILYVSIGSPLFVEIPDGKGSVSFSLSYHHRFLRSFAIEPFYLYAQNNNFPDFFDNGEQLDQHIRSFDRAPVTNWSRIFLHSFGARLHFAFIHNPRWYLSFNFGKGYFISESANHYITSFRSSYSPFQITDYEAEFHSRTNYGWFSMPGVLLKRNLNNRVSLGIHLTGYFFTDTGNLWMPKDKPVFPNHWNASITLGKSF